MRNFAIFMSVTMVLTALLMLAAFSAWAALVCEGMIFLGGSLLIPLTGAYSAAQEQARRASNVRPATGYFFDVIGQHKPTDRELEIQRKQTHTSTRLHTARDGSTRDGRLKPPRL
jgi:hypothetical protein